MENEGREGDSRRLKGNSLSKSLETEDLQGLFGGTLNQSMTRATERL